MPAGRSYRLSLARRMVCDFLRAGRHAELVTIERAMRLGPVHAARVAADPRPSWPVLFAKAAGFAAERCPELRQSYLPYPWPRLYEHSTAIGTVVVAKEQDGEEFLLLMHLHDLTRKSLAELDERVRRAKVEPISATGAFRRALRVGRLPWPLRQLTWSLLDWIGKWRADQLGTFGISATAGMGSVAVTMRTPWTASFHYGVFDADGSLTMRMTFDHRVFDGRAACQILDGIEAAMLGPVCAELKTMPGTARSAP